MATRALVGYFDPETKELTSTYNHYDGYPENLGKALETFYSEDNKAYGIANYGYISYVDPETGEIEAKNKDTADVLDLEGKTFEDAMEEIAVLADSYGAEYIYIYDPISNKWLHTKHYGIRSSMERLQQLLSVFGSGFESGEMENIAEGEMDKVLSQVMFKLQDEPKDMLDAYKNSLANDIRLNGPDQYNDFTVEDFIEDYNNYIQDKMEMDESFIHRMKVRAGIIK